MPMRRCVAAYAVCIAVVFFFSCAPRPKESLPGASYGISSWYGKDFHGKPTSSGEIFDMHARTCAHREYPFGTRLRVTYPETGKSVECTVNDRGPFVSGRDLDLSYAAARDIGLIGPGIARVYIEPVGRDERYVREVRFDATRGPYTIQVGSFRNKDNAVRLKTGLDIKYESVYIVPVRIKDASHFRVRIGNFTQKTAAEDLAKKLAFEGYEAIVTRYEGSR